MTMNGKELVKLLRANGWMVDHVEGSHHIMKKGKNGKGTIAVPVHGAKSLPKGLLEKLLKQAGLK